MKFLMCIIFGIYLKCVKSQCYFSQEYQGTYLTQSGENENGIQYTQVNITEEEIPIWGGCYRRIADNNVLLITNRLTGQTCIRCFQIKLVTPNVIRIFTDTNYTKICYTNEEKAIKSCPSIDNFLYDVNNDTEIMFYKVNQYDGRPILPEHCPINGRYKLTYNLEEGIDDQIECPKPKSELDICPSNSIVNLRFRECKFPDHEIRFECLGHWQGENNLKYIALRDSASNETRGPQFRCGIYDEQKTSGIIQIQFGNDSSCSWAKRRIKNQYGEEVVYYPRETITLFPIEEKSLPNYVINGCSFPDWMHGKWTNFEVTNQTIIYKDQSSHKTYKMNCIQKMESSNFFYVFSRTQCGEETHKCLWIEKRNDNILEFQIGSRTTKVGQKFIYNSEICNPMNFDDNRWLTIARLDEYLSSSPCPVNGNFTGILPDADGLCADLSSECISETIMFYKVSECENKQVYEDRDYRCLGQWTDNNLVYLYTKRRDVGTYECFVGTNISENQMYIKEAGANCQRGMDLYLFGMKLTKQNECGGSGNSVTNYDETKTTKNLDKTVKPNKIEKQFNEINKINNQNSVKKNHSNSNYVNYKLLVLIFLINHTFI